jgi:uncharacterized protein
MQLTNRFAVPASPDRTWQRLLDVERIAPCVPGASLTEVVNDRTFKGKATVKVGPISLSFDGVAELVEVDHDTRTARLKARGADAKGRGGAEAEARFQVEPDGDGSQVTVLTDLALSGGVAQYGRASGLLQEVANQIVAQFARNLADDIAAGTAAEAAAEAAANPAPADDPPAPPRPAAPRPAPANNAVSGLSLITAAIRAILGRSLGRLFGRKEG